MGTGSQRTFVLRIKQREEPSSLPASLSRESENLRLKQKNQKSDHLRLCLSSSEPPAPLSKVRIQCAHTCTICMCFLHKTSLFVRAISCIASLLQCYQLRHSYKIVAKTLQCLPP